MSRLTEAQILNLAKEQLRAHGLTYDEREGLQAEFVKADKTTNTPGAWCVSYVSQPGMFEQHDFFMYLADDTGKLLHILGPHGKLRLQ